MYRVLAAVSFAILASACKTSPGTGAIGPRAAAVMAPVHQFVDGFNKGDTKSAIAACEERMSIIDDFPPHEWHGVGALAEWMSEYDADAKAKGITEEVVAIGEPKHVDITGDRAYVVVPATYGYNQKGKPVKKSAVFTLALHENENGWRITGWCWAQD